MALEKSLDRGKYIETKSDEKKKKSYLRQLCERLHLDPTKDSFKNTEDIIVRMNKGLKYDVDKEYLKRKKQISDIFLRNRDQEIYSELEWLSTKIRSVDYLIAGKLSKVEQIRYSNHAAIREAFYPYYLDKKKQELVGPNKERERLIKKFQDKLSKYSGPQGEG
jgi:hypothetical protein